MSEETITVADVSDGPGGASDLQPGTPISVPVVEILTGRGFITGKSGSGKSNTASVVIENLLDNNFPVLIVDSDGEYYGLKEEYEILHAGADEECDIQVSDEHAEKIASLALEQNVPIILDVSGFLDEDVANALVRETARHLFAKEKKLKKPFLLLIEECHEYIPEGAGMDDTGRTLIKIGKRGRKHGLGIVGISQRPADVKKDFITQCDWLVWHRLTWDNDTKVVKRILGSEYGEAIEEVDDGEAFLMTDWAESIRRVQFHRKQTFDAGATPGLDDFERPDLKDVSGDLVSELQEITDEQRRRESELADLRRELDEKRQRIEQLERELEEARDMSQMADTFAQALLQKADASHRGGDGSNPARARLDEFTETGVEQPETEAAASEAGVETSDTGADGADGTVDVSDAIVDDDVSLGENDNEQTVETGDTDEADADDEERTDTDTDDEESTETGTDDEETSTETDADDEDESTDRVDDDSEGDPEEYVGIDTDTGDSRWVDERRTSGWPVGAGQSADGDTATATDTTAATDASPATDTTAATDASPATDTTAATDASTRRDTPVAGLGSKPAPAGGGTVARSASIPQVGDVDLVASTTRSGFESSAELVSFAAGTELRSREAVVAGFVDAIESFDEVTREMLAHYRDQRRSTPMDAHVAAGGSGNREFAYARNATLRRAGAIEHVARGEYRYRVPDLLREVYGGVADQQELAETLAIVEGQTGLAGEADDE